MGMIIGLEEQSGDHGSYTFRLQPTTATSCRLTSRALRSESGRTPSNWNIETFYQPPGPPRGPPFDPPGPPENGPPPDPPIPPMAPGPP
jgi:hypothetical protein